MSYYSYITHIKNALMLFGVKETFAKKKAEICRGFYRNEKDYMPVDEAVNFCTRRIPLIEFSVEGLKAMKKHDKSRAGEIEEYLGTCTGEAIWEYA